MVPENIDEMDNTCERGERGLEKLLLLDGLCYMPRKSLP
jgi:hypothetical protein